MAIRYIYRLEFINFEENTVRVDIGAEGGLNSGAISPTNVIFYTTGGLNYLAVSYNLISFFYVGQVFAVTGTGSNDGNYTVVSFSGGSTTTVVVSEAVVYESAFAATLTDTNPVTEPEVFTLVGTGAPLVISTINNDQDKFQPIRSKQAVIQFVSDAANGLDISLFSAGPDNKWTVDITIIGITPPVFKGFLILSDNQQPFQPDPQTVQLTATDHLGAIKDIALVDYVDQNPRGVYRIADLVTMCLRKTGLDLDLYVVNNLRTGSGELTTLTTFVAADPGNILIGVTNFFYPGQTFTVTGTGSNDGTYTVRDVGQGIVTIVDVVESVIDEAGVTATFTDVASSLHMYDVVRLDAKSFEKLINVSEDGYTDLSKILGKDCYVCQWAGAWWVMRVDEFNTFPIYAAHFDTAGLLVGIDTVGTSYDISIGATETRRFANADTLLQFIRPEGFNRLEYPFALPMEIPDNVDFERGALTTTVSDAEKHYELDDFDKLWSNTTTDDPATTPIYIRRDFFNDQEEKRYVVIEADATTNWNFILSRPIPVNRLDKFNIDISQRLSADIGGSGSYTINIVQVRLYGNDGTFWTCQGRNDVTDLFPIWVLSDATFRTNQKFFQMLGDLSEDFTESHGLFDGTSAEIPVEGYLRILVFANPQDVTAYDTYIDKLTFEYIPYINGSYQKYSADENRVDRIAAGYMAKIDEQVYVEDGPNRLTKGAMQIIGSFTEIISDIIDFAAPNSISIPGNVLSLFYVGQVIRIAGTASNDQVSTVTLVTYHLVGDTTEVQILNAVVTETSAAGISVGNLALTFNWYSSQPLALALNTDPDNIHSYGYIQIFSVWNQFRGSDNADGDGMGINIFTGSVLGLTTDWPDLLHKYLITDINAQTNDRYFMLLSMSQDWKSCIWTATLVEVINTAVGRIYTDTYSFKYIAQ